MSTQENQIAHVSNPCAGHYGKCLDVKITNQCNGDCIFCIERGGFRPQAASVNALIDATNALEDYKTVLILGGEPFLYNDLHSYLSGIFGRKEKIYLTTNGSCFHTQPKLSEIAEMLTGINISLHHFSQAKNQRITGTQVQYDTLREVIQLMKANDTTVRINANLMRGGIEKPSDVFNMICKAHNMGADEIRFAELQQAPYDFVSAREALSPLYPQINDDPFTQGCEQVFPTSFGIHVIVRQACGLVNPARQAPKNPVCRGSETKVLYPNGKLYDGWMAKHEKKPPEQRAEHGCHKAASEGCHPVCGCHASRW